MMGQRGVGNVELFLNFAYNQALGVGGEQQLHDPQARLGSHGGKHVGVFGDLFGGLLRSEGGLGCSHISIIAEIR
jgi:hypothetical protein